MPIQRSVLRACAHALAVTVLPVVMYAAIPLAAHAAPLPIDQMQVLSRQDSSASVDVEVFASTPAGQAPGQPLEVLVPRAFKLKTAEEFSTSAPGQMIGEVRYKVEQRGDESAIISTLHRGNGVRLVFTSPTGIFVQQGQHFIASLGLTAPTNIGKLLYGFEADGDLQGQGTGVVSFGKGPRGEEIFGQEFKNVKKGERKIGSVAFVPGGESEQSSGGAMQPANQQATGASAPVPTPLWLRPAFLGVLLAILIAIAAVIVIVSRRPVDEGWTDEASTTNE